MVGPTSFATKNTKMHIVMISINKSVFFCDYSTIVFNIVIVIFQIITLQQFQTFFINNTVFIHHRTSAIMHNYVHGYSSKSTVQKAEMEFGKVKKTVITYLVELTSQKCGSYRII